MQNKIDKEVNQLVSTHLDGDDADPKPPLPKGCVDRVRYWMGFGFLWKYRRTKISTMDTSSSSSSSSCTAVSVGSSASSKQFNRLFGVQKQQYDKIEAAIATVSIRIEMLQDRAKLQREKAVSLSKAGRKQDALRELRKAKSTDRQVLTTRDAFETLERQQDLLNESVLQKELATALASTNEVVKSKTKGLLPLSEKVVDQSQELRDATDDVAAVFEGLHPTYDNDDDALLEELDDLLQDSEAEPPYVAEKAMTHSTTRPAATSIFDFPEAPNTAVSVSPMAQETSAHVVAG